MALPDILSWFEIPPVFVEPALRMCRGFNTSLDAMFYDLPALTRDLLARGAVIETVPGREGPRGLIDLSADDNPEGALLVVDTERAPYVTAWHDVAAFLAWQARQMAAIEAVSITGVGSSALGSAALAWNVAMAIKAPVLAIVPGYGVADVITQALGGWFGFGLHDFLDTKSHLQDALAISAPRNAWIGRSLSASVPGSPRAPSGAPVFETGSGSSDVLHALLRAMKLKCLVGHSKGALSIGNAVRTLAAADTEGLRIVTLGCPIAEELEDVSYHQFLGLFDALGQANAWGHLPEAWTLTDHSTNTSLPLSMSARALAAA
jgi:hypothetical protein